MGPVGIILVNPPITTFQQSLTHSAMWDVFISPIDCKVGRGRRGSSITVSLTVKMCVHSYAFAR